MAVRLRPQAVITSLGARCLDLPRQFVRSRWNRALARDVVLGLAAIGAINLAIHLTGGLPNGLASLHYLPLLFLAFRVPLPLAILGALLAGLTLSPESLTQDNLWVQPLTFLLVVAITNSWSAQIRRQVMELLRDRKRVEESLHGAQEALEIRVQERTAELVKADQILKAEVAERKRAEEVQRALSQRLLAAQEEERRKIAYDIHDGLGQVIVAAGMHLEIYRTEKAREGTASERELMKGARYLDEAIAETRRIVSELRPALLDDFGLVEALRHYLNETATWLGWQLELEENWGTIRLDKGVETALFRIVQEALTNAQKYAQTEKVKVRLLRAGEELSLEVQDWGVGFDVETAWAKSLEGGHLGLTGMRERAQLLGSIFSVESTPGQGTLVRVSLALKQEAGESPTEVKVVKEEEQASGFVNRDGITVLIVDDHPMVREGLRAMLNVDGIHVVGEATTGAEAVEQVHRFCPDVVLMEVESQVVV